MKAAFQTLKSNHYSSNKFNASFRDEISLYKEMGLDSKALVKENPGYVNTCATRMSLALLKSGVPFVGRLKVRSGQFKGKAIEPGAKLLADQLAKPTVFGKPEIFSGATAMDRLKERKGVVFFCKIFGYDGGHIDLIETANKIQVCNSACYFLCQEVWFWSLD